MSYIQGLLSIANADAADYVGAYQAGVTVRQSKGQGSGAILFALLALLPTESCSQDTFNWFERDPVLREITANGAALIGATTLTVDNSTFGTVFAAIISGTPLENTRTGEVLLVTVTPTSDTLTVSRAFGGTAAAAVNDNDTFRLGAPVVGEGSGALDAVSIQPDILSNYIQIFKSTVLLTNSYRGGVLRSDEDGPDLQAHYTALEKISSEIEMQFFDGLKASGTISGKPFKTTGGIRAAIRAAGLTANVLNGNSGTGVTLSLFKAWLNSFMVNGGKKVLFCGSAAYSAISDYANSNAGGFRIMNSDDSGAFGLAIVTLVTPFGIVDLVQHPLFNNGKDSLRYAIYAVDLDNIKQVIQVELQLQEGIQNNDEDVQKDQFYARLGLKVGYAGAHGYAFNFQKILPDV